MKRSGLHGPTRRVITLATAGLLAVSGAVLGPAALVPAAATHDGYPGHDHDGQPGDDYGVAVEPGAVPGSGEFVSFCGVDTCTTGGTVLGRPLAGAPHAEREGWPFGAMVFPFQCLAPGTVGWFTDDSYLVKETIIRPAAVPDTGPLPPACGHPSAFVDMETDDVFYDEVAWLAEQGITHGWSDGTYRPREPIGRYAVAAFLYRMAGRPSPEPLTTRTAPFTDVTRTHPFHQEIAWMAEEGITTGWPDGTFRPEAPASRAMTAAFLYRMAGSPSYTAPQTPPFTDVHQGLDFYREISWLAEQGITTGWPDGTFRPGEPVNREQMAAFLHRYAHTVQ